MPRVIGHAERTLSESVPAAPDVVRDFCVDPATIETLHPHVSLRRMPAGASAGADDQDYRVSDSLALGLFAVPLHYTVHLRIPIAGAVTAEAHPVPTVRLEAVIAFEPIATGTRLKEHLRISAPRPLVGAIARRAVAAHAVMLIGVRRHFETLGAGRRGD